jgi:deoxyhypusine synthase
MNFRNYTNHKMKLNQLKPLQTLDISLCQNLEDLLLSMSKMSFGARNLGQAWLLLKDVISRPHCEIILTVSGAMTVAQLGQAFGSLIINSIVHSVITTGAVVTHSFVQEMGMDQFAAPPQLSDEILYKKQFNRIFDSIEPECNLNVLEKNTLKIFEELNKKKQYGSFELINILSKEILEASASQGLLTSALKKKINIFVPAFIDSEVGLYLFKYRLTKAPKTFFYDPMRDLATYTEWISTRKEIAFLTIGGGVPRNWAQQIIPFLKTNAKLGRKFKSPKIIAAVRICPDPVNLGHLSGSTYSEGISWGKFNGVSPDNLVEVPCDATIVFPLLAKALLDFKNCKQ